MSSDAQDSKRTGESGQADMTPSLVAKLRRGDPRAGAVLDQLYREALVRFCWGYLGRVEDAEDAVQDICYKVLAAKTVPDAFRPWIYKTARNHCLNLIRTRSRRKEGGALPAASQLYEVLTGHLTRLVRKEQQSRLREAVASLPDKDREVLRLRYVEGLSRGEIAEVLELPDSAVKWRLFEGLRRLREIVADSGNE